MKLTTVQVQSVETIKEQSIKKQSKKRSLKDLIVDIFGISVVMLIGLGLTSNLLKSLYFSTGYADWLIQAFRVRFIGEFGLSSWTHIWSNGISLWRSYQFLPHALTSGIASIFHIEITRAMVLLTIFQFICMRIVVYGIARSLKLSPITGLIAVILSYDLGQYWGGVDDYSILFGFTVFPIYIWLWIQYTKRKYQFLFPYLTGVSFYIHPLLGVYTVGLWLVGCLFKDSRPSGKTFLAQLVIVIASSALFWNQHFSGYIKNYSSTFFTSLAFFKQTLGNFYAYGLSIAVLIGFVLLWITLPVTKEYKWVKVLAMYSALCLIAVYVSLHIQLPGFIAETQYSRGMSFVGLAIIVGIMPLIEKAIRMKALGMRYLLIAFVTLTMVEAINMSSSLAPHAGTYIEDPVSALVSKFPERNISSARVWSPYLDSANYKAPLSTRYPVSYMTHSDSNQVSVRFSDLLLYNSFQDKVPATAIARVKDYMYITSTQYIIFEKSSPFTRTLIGTPDADLEDLGEIEMKRSIYHIFALKDADSRAINIHPDQKNQLTLFPTTLNPADPQDQNALDEYVHNWVKMLNNSQNEKLSIKYPSQDALDVSIPQNHISSTIYIPESYSPNWRAWFNGAPAQITAVGPNFMKVEFVDTYSYGLLTLKHDWSWSWYLSVAIIFILPAAYLVIRSMSYTLSKIK